MNCAKCNSVIPDNEIFLSSVGSYTICLRCQPKKATLENQQLQNTEEEKKEVKKEIEKKPVFAQEQQFVRAEPERDYSSSVINRYRDAYTVCKITIVYGGLIKNLAILIAAIIAGVGVLMILTKEAGFISLGVILIALGLGGGISIYLGGLIVAAQGQMLRASLDSTVGSSPFLTREQKAKTMGIS